MSRFTPNPHAALNGSMATIGRIGRPGVFMDTPPSDGSPAPTAAAPAQRRAPGSPAPTRSHAAAGQRGNFGQRAAEAAADMHPDDTERDAYAAIVQRMNALMDAHEDLVRRVETGEIGRAANGAAGNSNGNPVVPRAGATPNPDTGFDPSQVQEIRTIDDARSAIQRLYQEREDAQRERDDMQRSIQGRYGLDGLSEDGSELKNADGKYKRNKMGLDPVAQCIVGSFHGFAGGEEVWPVLPILRAYHMKSGLPLDTGSAGQLGALIPPQLMDEMIDRLSARTVAISLGARLTPLDGSPVRWNRNQMNTSASWVGEGIAPGKSDAALGMLQLMPKELAAATDIQKRLLMLTNNRAQEVIEDDLERAIAEALDLGIIRGSGGNAQPMGIVNTPGIGQTDFSSAYGGIEYGDDTTSQNVTKLLDLMIAKVDARNAYSAQGSNAFAAHPLAVNQLRTAQDRNGNHILAPFMDRAQLNQAAAVGAARGELWGHPLGTTSNLLYGATGTDLVFGDWSQIIVGQWGPLMVEASNSHESNFLKGLITVRMEQLVDAGVRHVEAFEMATSWTAVEAITL